MRQSSRPQKEKQNLHPRNRHRDRYDFPALIRSCPELKPFVTLNAYGELSVDFSDLRAVKVLNKALLKHVYGIALWDIPQGYLCPPIPGRADYIHYAADLLAPDAGAIPRGPAIRVLDIGVGANSIYPLIGVKEYGWKFAGTDIDPVAVRFARNMVEANDLASLIDIRKQASREQMFGGIWRQGEFFDLTICNPPFYGSSGEAASATRRKWTNLERGAAAGTRNFGGTGSELWCSGGEAGFLQRMIAESALFGKRCLWFTSLVSSKDSLYHCNKALERAGAAQVRTIGMSQGQKKSRMLAWSFLAPPEMAAWRSRWRP
ncbi:MAG TPA: 23S rRNA (adenine(1618)-N(6))-methyltransferase RlmF [Sphingobacteriaceae bacterium]